MDPKELRGLMEAYSEVYAPQEELDEASRRDEFTRAAIARNSGRKGGITFEPGPNWDPSANRGRGAHLNPKQKEKQRRKALRQEELDIFDVVLEFLQVEGFAETLEEAEWMMANMIDEEAIDIILGEGVPLRGTTPDGKPWRVDPSPSGARQPAKMERNPKERTSPKGGDYKSKLKKSDRYEEVEYVDEAQHARENPEKYEREQGSNTTGQSKYGRRAPAGYMQTRKPTLQQMSSREKQAFRDRGIGEEYVDEAQHARENPEKYEREQSKKYAPVRGEKTPMPPRGDKRREDFEKWYAKQMGR